jgi:hypothetical protein
VDEGPDVECVVGWGDIGCCYAKGFEVKDNKGGSNVSYISLGGAAERTLGRTVHVLGTSDRVDIGP